MSLPEVPTAEELIQSTDFKDMIVRNLHKPMNKTGLVGPVRGGERWERWLHQIIDGKVTKKYYRGEKKLWPEDLVISVRQEVIGLATKERAKLKAFEEILTQRSDLTRKSADSTDLTQESGSTQKPTWSSAVPRQVVLEDTPEPEPTIKPELAKTPQQPTPPRQLVLKFNVGDQSNWELACETARKSGAVSAKVVLSFRWTVGDYDCGRAPSSIY